jgi:uncharacterized protein
MFSKFSKIIIFTVFFLLFASKISFALDLPEIPKTYVSDDASILSPGTRQTLENDLAQFEKDNSNQILVVTLPNLQGDTIEEFAIRLAEKWKPGQKGRDNGVILLISKEDRKVRIEVGYGLEGVLTDALSKDIIQNEIIPNFKTQDYDQGVLSAVSAIEKATRGEYQSLHKTGDESKGSILIGLFLAIFILLVLRNIFRSAKGFWMGGSGGVGGGWGSSGSSGSSGGSWGGSSSGFSSGGGSFGGGGSSGSW